MPTETAPSPDTVSIRQMPAPPPPPPPLIEWSRIRRALVVRLDNVGDVVMLTPSLRALRGRLPSSHISLLTSPAGGLVADMIPWIDGLVVHSPLWQQISPRPGVGVVEDLDLVDTLAHQGFDAAFIFTSFRQSPHPPAFACLLAGIDIRAGQSKEFGGLVLTHAVDPLDDAVHQVDRNLHLLESLGIAAPDRVTEVRPPLSARDQADGLLASAGLPPGEPYLVLAPTASCPARSCSPQQALALTDRITRRLDCPVVVVGGDRPRDLEAARFITGGVQTGSVVSLAGMTSIPVLASIVAGAAVAVTTNSGALHLADATATPQVVLYSGTDLIDQWRPRQSEHVIVTQATTCSPCYRLTCPFDMECLDLDLDEVVAAVGRLLGTGRPVKGAVRLESPAVRA